MHEFILGNEDEVVNNPNTKPTAAFVIVESEKGYMLLYTKYRHVWELTGGMLDEGESPKDCVIRECKEESNQNISEIKFVGLAVYANMNAAVYYTFLMIEDPFIENDEIEKLQWWKPGEEIGEMCMDSVEFIKLYNPTE
jgi:8-oxo-dGTP diphosphatase